MRTFDEEIAHRLKEAAESGELGAAKGYGKLKNRVPTTGPARKREQNRRVDFTVLQEAW